MPSIVSVRASQAARTAASSPTATIVPSRQATAVAHGCAGSSVRIRAPSTATSAELRIAASVAPAGHHCARGGDDDHRRLARGAHLRRDLGPDRALVRRARAHERHLARDDVRDVAARLRRRRAVPGDRHDRLRRDAARASSLGGIVLNARHLPYGLADRAAAARPALEARALESDRARRVDGARARAAHARAQPPRVLRLRLLAVRRLEPRHADRRARGRSDRRPVRARARRRVPGQHARPAGAAPAAARRARRRARRRASIALAATPFTAPGVPILAAAAGVARRRASCARSPHDLVGDLRARGRHLRVRRPPGRSRSARARCRRRCSARSRCSR